MEETKFGFRIIDGMDDLLQECYRYEQEQLVIAGISGSLWEMLERQEDQHSGQLLLSKLKCNYLLLVATFQEKIRLLFFSNNKCIRALEFLDALVSQYGLVKGDSICAILPRNMSTDIRKTDILGRMEKPIVNLFSIS